MTQTYKRTETFINRLRVLSWLPIKPDAISERVRNEFVSFAKSMKEIRLAFY
jgi:hypothetical protein